MMNPSTIAPERAQTGSGIARAALKSAAPSPVGETLRLSRRPCTASLALVGGGALLRVESLFAVALPDLVEKGDGKRWRWVFKLKPCAPCRKSGSGPQKEQCDGSLQMRSAPEHRQVQGQHMRAPQASDSSGRASVLVSRGSTPLVRRRRLRQSRKPGVFGEFVRRGEQHFDVRSNATYQGDCARCGRKVRSDENYLKAHLWASTAVFHWACFIALMKEQGETAAEDATSKASRVSRS
jgi:hypothetical protein